MRDAMKTLAAAGAAWLLLGAPTAAATVEEVIGRHIEARGGEARWKAIESLKISGSMTAWSKKAPFALERKRDRYHLNTTQDGKKLEIGFDGQTAWWDNQLIQEGAQKIQGADLVVLMREIDFPTPFFGYRDKGYEVKLLGPTQFEGQKAIAIELKRADGVAETWYLDPATHLEFARESPGSDFGNPVPLRTYYDDFRTVAGVKVPFRVESQWYTRERILQADSIEAGVPIDDSVFRMPPPTGMGPLLSLSGSWKVAVAQRNSPGAPWRDSERESTIEALLGGAVIQERFTTPRGSQVLRSFTYDRFRKRYLITEVNDTSTYLDLNAGDFDDQKRLVVSNQSTGTTFEAFGMTFNSRLTISEITPDGFKIEEEVSTDGGKEWFLQTKATYTRRKE